MIIPQTSRLLSLIFQTKAEGANGSAQVQERCFCGGAGAPLANAAVLLVGDTGTNGREVRATGPGHPLDNISRIPI